jgi:hypothetical protein
MAMTTEWDHVVTIFKRMDQYTRARPTVAAMLRMVATLRRDPRLEAVVPNVTHASLTLRVTGSLRYIIVEWREEDPDNFAISFVDPPVDVSGEKVVPEAEAADTVVDYLEQLKSHQVSCATSSPTTSAPPRRVRRHRRRHHLRGVPPLRRPGVACDWRAPVHADELDRPVRQPMEHTASGAPSVRPYRHQGWPGRRNHLGDARRCERF